MLSVNHLDIRYGDKHLFKDVSIQIYEGNRVGLVGVNGAGKSTLLKIMAGDAATDDGVLSVAKNFSIGYLPQESTELFSGNSLYYEAEKAFDTLLSLQKEAEKLQHAMQKIDPNSEEFANLLERHGEVQHLLEGSDIYTIRSKVEKVLLGLGFSNEDMDRPVSTFSGGWQMRLKLAKMLLEAPSLLLLDEPTNHLDLDSLTWVEQFLLSYKGAMVIISHDRMFLDKVTERTWDLSFGRLEVYKGNYSYYLREKAERRAIEKGAYANQQAKIKQTQRFVEKFRAKATKARQVQSRVKQLEKMELIELSNEEQQIRFTFPPAPPSGRDVLLVEGVSKEYSGKTIFAGVDFLLSRGDKVAVVGVNGAGKSTLVKILAGAVEYDSGQVRVGTNVSLSYFGQHQAQELAPQFTVLETMALSGKDKTLTQTRSLLGAFLFRGDDVEKKVAVLSGGEKSRLALAKMIATPANCMLLDEPTNHLDMNSQEVLQEAMAQYDGTVIVVSHNRYFLDSFVNRVMEVKAGKVTLYEGNVADYLYKQEQLKELDQKQDREVDSTRKITGTAADSAQENRKDRKRLEAQVRQERSRRAGPWLKKLQEAEEQVEKLEKEKEDLEALMADPNLYTDGEKWAKVNRTYEECRRRLERWFARWESAQAKVDEIDEELHLQRTQM